MTLLRNMPLSRKLPLMIITLLALACLSLTAFFVWQSRQAELQVAEATLGRIVTEDSAALQSWVNTIRNDLEGNAQETQVTQALQRFDHAFESVGDTPTETLQQAYIANNPHPTGQKHLLDYADDRSPYSITHRRYHPLFRTLRQVRGYHDIFLFDTDGNLVYSVYKQADFATNFNAGPFADSGLGDAYRSAMERAGSAQPVAFVDFAPYRPSGGAFAGFAAIALRGQAGETLGVMVMQVPTDQITPLLRHSGSELKKVNVSLIGGDHLPRDRAFDEGTALVKSPAIEAALAGQSGEVKGLLMTGEQGVGLYAPVELAGFRWAVVAEQSYGAIFARSNRLLQHIAIGCAALMLVGVAAALWMSRGITLPVNRVHSGLERLAQGQYDSPMGAGGRQDEIGQMAESAESLRHKLVEARAAELDNTFRGAGFQAGSSPMMLLDGDLTVTYANEAMFDFFESNAAMLAKAGKAAGRDAMVGRPLGELMPNASQVKAALARPEELPTTVFFRIEDTRFALKIAPVRDERGEVIGTVAEWANATQDFLDRALMNSIDRFLATIRMDRAGRVLSVNDTMAKVLGRQSDSLRGEQALDVFDFDETLAFERGALLDRLDKGEDVFGLFKLCGADGKRYWLQGGFSPVLDTDGKPAMFLFVGSDITVDREKLLATEEEQARKTVAQELVVDRLRSGLKALAEGDLTLTLDESFAPEYEELRHNYNDAATGLRQAMALVLDNSGTIHREVRGIVNSADDLSRRTEKQATTLEETAAALDQLTSSVRSAAEGATQANQMANDARGNAEKGGDVVSEAVSAMSEIAESSEKITKIINVIDDIAFQTNLLALNAGVEAARAGEAGRGFAVVASEVRALAQRSSEAAREINALISASGDSVRRGVDLVGETGNALRGIVASVKRVASNVGEIAASAQEQSAGLGEINSAMNQLDQVTQQNAAMFEETNAASQALSDEADGLRETMAQFRLGDVSEMSTPPEPTLRRQEASVGTDAPASIPPPPTFQSARRPVPAGSAALAPEPETDRWEEF